MNTVLLLACLAGPPVGPRELPRPARTFDLGEGRRTWSLAFAPDGKHVAAGDVDGSISVVRVADGKVVHRLNGHTDVVHRLAYSPDGRWLASAAWYPDPVARLWDAERGTLKKELKDGGQLSGLAFTPDGKGLLTANLGQGVTHWTVPGGEKRTVYTVPKPGPRMRTLAIAVEGDHVLILSELFTLTEVPITGGKAVGRVLYKPPPRNASHLVSPGPGSGLLLPGRRGAVINWLGTSLSWPGGKPGEPLLLRGPDGSACSGGIVDELAASPSGRLVAIGSSSGLAVNEPDTGVCVVGGEVSGDLAAVAFSPDGRWLAAGFNRSREVRLWDLAEVWKLPAAKRSVLKPAS